MLAELVVRDKKGITEIGRSKRSVKRESRIKAAENIMTQMRQKIIRKYPVLSYAFHYLRFVPVEEKICLETDGRMIFYSPVAVLEKAKQRKLHELEYACTHILVHGMLGHFEIAGQYERSSVMHTLMDVEVRKFIKLLDPMMVSQPPVYSSMYICELLRDSRSLKTMYKDIVRSGELKRQLLRIRKDLMCDDHRVWYRGRKYTAMVELPDTSEGYCGQGGSTDGATDQGILGVGRSWDKLRKEMFGNAAMGYAGICKCLIRDREGMSLTSCGGTQAGEDEFVVVASDRGTLNYRSMLRRFFKNKERSRENIDGIDKTMYAWGFDTYGDVAFIEPETEAEDRSMNTIVVAIDTSGSCEGEVMKHFLSETRSLFSDIGTSVINKIVVVQCDAKIQKVDVYRRTSELPGAERFANGMAMYGFGGTSFEPVFDYTDRLVEGGEKVDCLIYLTDGYGTFPSKSDRPYETFFVLDRTDCDIAEDEIEYDSSFIPDWIHRVYLRK